MRRRYWLPGGALIGVGLVLRLFFVYLHFAGMFLMGVGAVVLLFGLVDALLPRFVWLRVVRLVMRIGAGLVALAMLVTGIAVGVACGGSKNPEGAAPCGADLPRDVSERRGRALRRAGKG